MDSQVTVVLTTDVKHNSSYTNVEFFLKVLDNNNVKYKTKENGQHTVIDIQPSIGFGCAIMKLIYLADSRLSHLFTENKAENENL